MTVIDYSNFQKSLKALEDQFANYQNMDDEYLEFIQQGVKESVNRRFKVCHDCLHKVLARYLKDELGVAEVSSDPKPILRIAGENQILESSVDQWIHYVEVRNDIAHDYGAEKTDKCLAVIEDFIDDAIQIYQHMSGRLWK